MIDTTIEIRATDRAWLIRSLEYLVADLKDQAEGNSPFLPLGKPAVKSGHNYDVYYIIQPVKELA